MTKLATKVLLAQFEALLANRISEHLFWLEKISQIQ